MEVLQIKFGIKSNYFDIHIFQVKFVTENMNQVKGKSEGLPDPYPYPTPWAYPPPTRYYPYPTEA